MSFDMRALLAVLLVVATPAIAEECRYEAADGRSISFDQEPGYMVERIGDDERFCAAAGDAATAIVDCPTSGETVVVFTPAGLTWQGVSFEKRCNPT